MALWQWGLLLLAVVWAVQSFGVWRQMRHYGDVFKGITDRFGDGYVGTGVFRGRLRKGAIAIVVVSPDLVVRRLLVMSGRSVFAKFQRVHQAEDLPLARLRESPDLFSGGDIGVTEATRQAVAQVDDRLAKPKPEAQPDLIPLTASV